MYNDYHENKDIRKLDNIELLKRIPDTFDIYRFELDADAIYQKRNDYSHLKENGFDLRFKKTMDLMGAEYVLEEKKDNYGQIRTHVRITNAEKLIAGLEKAQS